MRLTILHTNDFHGRLDDARVEALIALRAEHDALYLDSGDCIVAGNLAIPVAEDPAWANLARAGCAAGVPGNRESHPLKAAFAAKLRGVQHPLVCANLRYRKQPGGPLPASVVLEHGGVRVGVVGVMVPMVTERMATAPLSAYLWVPPIPAAATAAEALRPEVDLLVALTHIGHKQDLELAECCPAFDLVLGGHSHTVVETPERVGDTWVCQGGSHGRFAGLYTWEKGKGLVEGRLVDML